MTLLQATHLSKSFGKSAALVDANVSVRHGEIVAVMGSSGSGKSTLLHCLAGITTPTTGSLSYKGQDILAMSDDARAKLRLREFGFVFQFGQLVPELTCLENIALPLRLTGISHRRAQQEARDLAGLLKVLDVADKHPGEASGGQAQRVAIARALIGTPSIIFADEPTGALDSLNSELVMQLMITSAKDIGASIVMVTHESRIAAYADREIVVRDGLCADVSQEARI
jgi:putative ABC transport system ATP-binding protein